MVVRITTTTACFVLTTALGCGLLAGCGTGDSTASTPAPGAPSASTSPKATPATASPTAWTVAQACSYYSKAKATNTVVLKEYNATDTEYIKGVVSWTTARAASRSAAASTRTYVRALRTPPKPWPADMAADIATIVKFRLAVAGVLDQMGSADTLGAWNQWYSTPWTTQSMTDGYNTASESLKVTCGL